jgi:hypothetical protein
MDADEDWIYFKLEKEMSGETPLARPAAGRGSYKKTPTFSWENAGVGLIGFMIISGTLRAVLHRR